MHPIGICYQAYIPMRKVPDEASEMVNQVLFGESFSVIEEIKTKNFSLIRLHHDQYEGWINTKCIRFVSDKDFEEYSKLPALITHDVLNFLQSETSADPMLIGCGSILRLSSPSKIRNRDIEYKIPEIPLNDPSKNRKNLVNYGLKLISIPYLWGGRGSFGFDCSGLCQNLYRQVGIEIPRDASAQAIMGHPLIFIDEAQAGDLAFFDDAEGNIIHVGMILNEDTILHASGRVKIDLIDHQGIFSQEQNRYTHSLRLLKKIVD